MKYPYSPLSNESAAVQDSNIIMLLDLVRWVKIEGHNLTPYQSEVKKMAEKYGVPSPYDEDRRPGADVW